MKCRTSIVGAPVHEIDAVTGEVEVVGGDHFDYATDYGGLIEASQAVAEKKSRFTGVFRSLGFAARHWVIFGLIVLFAWGPISDELVLSANAGTEAEQMADTLGMTRQGKLIFYRGNPKAQEKPTFHLSCPNSIKYPELGCYHRGNIYYLKIDNDELSELMHVTAAHELLHAAYTEMGGSEKAVITRLVVAEAARMNNHKLNETLAEYEKQGGFDAGSRADELHSFLGTEYGPLSPELERHYAKFFTNRAHIIATNTKVEAAVQQKIDSFTLRGNALNRRIDNLTAMGSRMDYLSRIGQIYTYNSMVDAYNAERQAILDEIESYKAEQANLELLFAEIDSTQLFLTIRHL